MSLRGEPVEESAPLPDGREALVRVGVPDDPYVAKRDRDTVAVEVVIGEQVAASVTTVLEADQDGEARRLAREIAAGLRSGALEPTAHSIEPLADALPS